MNKSIWMDDLNNKTYSKLENNITCDILIIGGGITGISTAYFLKKCNKKIVVVDSNRIATGTTAKSTGKLTFLQDNVLENVIKIYGKKIANLYLKSQQDAIELASNIIKDNNIDCNFQKVKSYLFTMKKSNVKKLDEIFDTLKNNVELSYQKNIPIKTSCIKALESNDTYVFHPVKFVTGMAKCIKDNVKIYENTRIISIEKKKNLWYARTKENIISAKQVVLACHYPFFLIPYFFPFKTTIEKSFLAAVKVDEVKSFSAINIDSNVLSFRYHSDKENYFIMCSETNDLSKNINDLKFQHKLLKKLQYYTPNKASYSWSNHDIITFDYLPLTGKIDENLYIATGFNTWGMTNGILAGKVISDILLKKKNNYVKLFNPLRANKPITNLINYNFKNGLSFVDTKINKNRTFYKSNVKIVKENGIWYGVYIDENNVEHKVKNKCPHMKCNLSFNYQNKTWDCPCHGSSFDIDGNMIYGPANYDIKINKN